MRTLLRNNQHGVSYLSWPCVQVRTVYGHAETQPDWKLNPSGGRDSLPSDEVESDTRKPTHGFIVIRSLDPESVRADFQFNHFCTILQTHIDRYVAAKQDFNAFLQGINMRWDATLVQTYMANTSSSRPSLCLWLRVVPLYRVARSPGNLSSTEALMRSTDKFARK